uniref:glycerophosphodiester phosphodiesterase n=1 Tax=Nelumbo nucifera TaxID=4432 RepID=A0A822XNI8_NELNU|nr:TPA_asm: hypothetical protein HUJ06_021778 [Nelumbo nucifera]
MLISRPLFLLLVLHSAVLITSQRSSTNNSTSPWLTLNGKAPLVIAKGGFSGLFPDSSYAAYSLANMTSLSNVILWCDVQLTKDAVGICFPDLKLDNSSDIANVFKNSTVYLVNGQLMKGYFPVDYTLNDLANVYYKFDGNLFSILRVEELASLRPPGLWLNIQHDAFYTQHNLSMRSFVLSVSRRVIVNYISSPEVAFLSSIAARFRRSTTKLVFRFLGADDIEPSTNQTYGSLLQNLTFVKAFASGILVPKTSIWPVTSSLYLQPPTSVVSNAHKEGLEVFASDFTNDVPLSYNYSYDPIKEYLNFIDNGVFSVDGVLSDFPITPSEAIDCFAHANMNSSGKANPLIISHNGASGDYPGSTDLAYMEARDAGADVIDCSVQMTQDGIPICSGSINLIDTTNVAQSKFNTRTTNIPQIQSTPGIFTFNLTWEEIKKLKPVISNPFLDYGLFRNPVHKNDGQFFSLDDFMAFAKGNSLPVLISIEHAAYLVENLGFNVIDAVVVALNKSGYNNENQKVMIQSTNSSVLMKFMEKTNYKLVYSVDEFISDIDDSAIKDIKRFAHSVAITKSNVFPVNQAFITGMTKVVSKLQAFNLTAYVYLFRNEFVSQAWDVFSDPTVEINTFVTLGKIDGIISDFPGTAAAYRKNRCLGMGKNIPIYMTPVQPGSLMQVITPDFLPPAEAPNPVLEDSNVAEPPFPSAKTNTSSGTAAASPTSPKPSGQPRRTTCVFLSSLGMLLASLLFF